MRPPYAKAGAGVCAAAANLKGSAAHCRQS